MQACRTAEYIHAQRAFVQEQVPPRVDETAQTYILMLLDKISFRRLSATATSIEIDRDD